MAVVALSGEPGRGAEFTGAGGREVIEFGGTLACAEGRDQAGFAAKLTIIDWGAAGAGTLSAVTGTLADSGTSSQPASMSSTTPPASCATWREPAFALEAIGWYPRLDAYVRLRPHVL